MHKSILFALFFALITPFLALSTFQPTQGETVETMRKRYIAGLETYQQALQKLTAQASDATVSVPVLRSTFRELRHAYKQMEFLLAYLDEDNARDFLNGAPLPSMNRYVPQVEVYQPRGMQPIEEVLYEETPDRTELLRLCAELTDHYKAIHASQRQLPFTDRQILEAVRTGIFRVTALGLTGFDTPGSGEALAECAVSLEAMQSTCALYVPHLPSAKKTLGDSIQTHFSGAVKTLRLAKDFESFDRMNFIRNYLDPLYGQVLRLHLALGIETHDLVDNQSRAVNYRSESMFTTEVLNDHHFAGIGSKTEAPAVVTLGKMLFFDPLLSSGNDRSCASCHQPDKAFSDGLAKSMATGYEGTVSRNAPTLINSVFADMYFADLRSDRLDNQAEHVIFNTKEFNTDYYKILDKLNQSDEYTLLFKQAFGKKPAAQEINRALAAFVRSFKAFNSPADRYLRGENIVLDTEVQQGFNLFMGKALCATCHFVPTYAGLVPPFFKENESEVIGVPFNPKASKLEIDPDLGRFESGRPRDRASHLLHSFKTTTVRNVALTAPYMHNGMYNTLEEVVDFYNKGGGTGLGIDIPNQTLPFDNLQLSKTEERALVRFMQALTDTSGLTSKPTRLPVVTGLNDRKVGGVY
ncbi:MAG: cytochrome C peroxidase [Saprospiraceae bacterium]|nr:cytochrome C peroxidase [Saprospiraceae bacterium]